MRAPPVFAIAMANAWAIVGRMLVSNHTRPVRVFS